MSWVQADHHFQRRVALFVLSDHEAMEHGLWKSARQWRNDKPEIIEREVWALINFHRPELSGGVLEGMDYDLAQQCWKFAVSHGSLPEVPWGNMLAPQPLIPRRDESDTPVTARRTD